MSETDRTDRWVARLNALGCELDEVADSMHPSAWHEGLASIRAKWLKLAQAGTTPQPEPEPMQRIYEQLSLFGDTE